MINEILKKIMPYIVVLAIGFATAFWIQSVRTESRIAKLDLEYRTTVTKLRRSTEAIQAGYSQIRERNTELEGTLRERQANLEAAEGIIDSIRNGFESVDGSIKGIREGLRKIQEILDSIGEVEPDLENSVFYNARDSPH